MTSGDGGEGGGPGGPTAEISSLGFHLGDLVTEQIREGRVVSRVTPRCLRGLDG